MRINGLWHKCDDGMIRPILVISVAGSFGTMADERFLIDSGADRTVFSASLLNKLGGEALPVAPGISLSGIGGSQEFVQIKAELKLSRDDGQVATVEGNFAAFTDSAATDFSILGRDLLDHFELILSRRRGEILLLAPPSRYEICRS